MTEAQKNPAAKRQKENALDLGHKNRKKVKKSSNVLFKLFYW